MTKYLGPTNTKGARIRATWQRFDDPVSVTIGYDYTRTDRDNHAQAAMQLVQEYIDGGGNWAAGELPSGNGYAFVMLGEEFSRYFGIVV